MNRYRIYLVAIAVLTAIGCEVRYGERKLNLRPGDLNEQKLVEVSHRRGSSEVDANSADANLESAEKAASSTEVLAQTPEAAALDLTLREVKLELQLRNESDAEKRTALQIEIARLREQRKSLYEQQHEGPKP